MVNRLKKLPFRFKEILKVTSSVARKLDADVYLVGGVVRDLILGKLHFDLDIVVEGDAMAVAKALAKHYGLSFRRHHAFGTATVDFGKFKVDFATARRERYTHWGALPKVKPAGLKDDLYRRDFTINAMAISLNKKDYGTLIDYYGGARDLKGGVLRVLHKNSFLEDPTRILRAIRFEQRFLFKIEKNTYKWMKEAVFLDALKFVNPHRLRDEVILILKEPKPHRYIKRIRQLIGLSFLDRTIKLKNEDFRLFLRIEKALAWYKNNFKKHRLIEGWVIYMAALLIRVSKKRLLYFLDTFGLKKGERIRLISIKENILTIRKLSKKLKPHKAYSILSPLSFEAILFFYAYYNDRLIRDNIRNFLAKSVSKRLKIKGNDLKKMGVQPQSLYSKIFEKVLGIKINKGLKTKQEELNEARRVAKTLVKRHK